MKLVNQIRHMGWMRAAAAALAGETLAAPLAAIGRPIAAVTRSARDYSRGFLAWSFAPATTLASVRGEIARLTAAEKSGRARVTREPSDCSGEAGR